jgi:putative ABC transport system permease protein
VLLVAVAALLVVVAVVLLGPAAAPRLASVVGRPLRRLGVPGTLAAQSAARSPRRTAATVTALALSLGLIVSMGIVAASIKASVRSTYSEVVSADFVVESARGEMLGGLVPAAHHAVEALPEVGVVSRMRYGHWKDAGATRALTAVDPDTLDEVTDVDMAAGSLSSLRSGGIVLSVDAARAQGVGMGDELTMTFARTGDRDLEVVGIVEDADAQALSTDYLLSLDTYAQLFSERMDATLFVGTAEGVAAEQAEEALRAALADLPTAEVRDQQAAVDGRTMTVDQILGLVTVLLMFTVLIALLGITNTLALSIVERTREIGLLRAVGMTRRQLRAMIRGEAVLVAALALVVAVALGAALGLAMVAVLGRSADVTLQVPTTQLVLVVVLATVTGVLAGLLPARRAARTDVLTAIATQ